MNSMLLYIIVYALPYCVGSKYYYYIKAFPNSCKHFPNIHEASTSISVKAELCQCLLNAEPTAIYRDLCY